MPSGPARRPRAAQLSPSPQTRRRADARWPGAPNAVMYAFPFDEGHGVSEEIVRLLDRLHRNYVGMGEARRRSCLAQESVTQQTAARVLGGQDLERDRTIEPDVACEVHGPHPAASEL